MSDKLVFTTDGDDVVSWDRYPTISTSASLYTATPPEPEPKITAGYMVSVDGNNAPKIVHATIEDAKQEAERLSKSQTGKVIRVMMLVGVYEPSHTWKELV